MVMIMIYDDCDGDDDGDDGAKIDNVNDTKKNHKTIMMIITRKKRDYDDRDNDTINDDYNMGDSI